MALPYLRGSLLLMLFGSITAISYGSSGEEHEVVLKLSDYTDIWDRIGLEQMKKIQEGEDACKAYRIDRHTHKYTWQDAAVDCWSAVQLFEKLPEDVQGDCYGFKYKSGGPDVINTTDCVPGYGEEEGYCAITFEIQKARPKRGRSSKVSPEKSGNRNPDRDESRSPSRNESREGSKSPKVGDKRKTRPKPKKSPLFDPRDVSLKSCIAHFKIEL